MTLKVFTAEGYTDGATVTTANTGSGDAFADVYTGAGGAITATATGALKGTRSYRIAPDGTTPCALSVAFPAVSSTSVFRTYFRKAGNPSAAIQFIRWRSAGGGTSHAVIGLQQDGYLTVQDLNSTNTLWTSPDPLADNTTYRLEASFSNTGLTVTSGAFEFRVYLGDSTSAWNGGTGAATASITGVNLGTTAPAWIQFPKVSSVATVPVFLLDDIGVADGTTTLLGPTSAGGVAVTGDAARAVTATRTATGTVTTAGNTAPTANAGPDQANVEPFATVTLTGAASTDPDGTIATYTWTQTAGASVTLTGTGATRTFPAPGALTTATLTFSLTVTDNLGATSAPDTVTITVLPASDFRRSGGAWVPLKLSNRSAGAWV